MNDKQTIAWYDEIDNGNQETAAVALADIGAQGISPDDILYIAKRMTDAMLETLDEMGIAYPELPTEF